MCSSDLQDIAEALGVNLETFFKEEKDEKIVFKQEDYFEDQKEDSKIIWIVPNAQKNEMEPILLELNPAGKSKEIFPHEGEEFGYVLRGKIALVNLETNQKSIIKKGETFYIKGDFSHCIENASNQISQLIWTCTPPIF